MTPKDAMLTDQESDAAQDEAATLPPMTASEEGDGTGQEAASKVAPDAKNEAGHKAAQDGGHEAGRNTGQSGLQESISQQPPGPPADVQATQ